MSFYDDPNGEEESSEEDHKEETVKKTGEERKA